jgi:hypothetical protein
VDKGGGECVRIKSAFTCGAGQLRRQAARLVLRQRATDALPPADEPAPVHSEPLVDED